jgi:hypothetical protein
MRHPFHFINIDATQHPDTVFQDVLSRIELIGKGSTVKAIHPKTLAAIQGSKDEEIIKQYKESELEPEEHSRELGPFNVYCPVSLVLDKELVKGNLANVLAYKVLKLKFTSRVNYSFSRTKYHRQSSMKTQTDFSTVPPSCQSCKYV